MSFHTNHCSAYCLVLSSSFSRIICAVLFLTSALAETRTTYCIKLCAAAQLSHRYTKFLSIRLWHTSPCQADTVTAGTQQSVLLEDQTADPGISFFYCGSGSGTPDQPIFTLWSGSRNPDKMSSHPIHHINCQCQEAALCIAEISPSLLMLTVVLADVNDPWIELSSDRKLSAL